MTWPAGVVCATCWNAGWVKRGHELARCPECHGASQAARDSKAVLQAVLRREQAETERIRERHCLGPLGTRTVDILAEKMTEPPPADFVTHGVPIPTTVTEEQRERAKARLAAATQALAGKLTASAR